RIYRMSWSGTGDEPALPLRGVDSWAKVHKKTNDELIEVLSSDEGSDREKARQELVRRGTKNRPALLKLLRNGQAPPFARINALAALQSMYDDDVQKGFVQALGGGDEEVRRVAAEALAVCAKKGDRTVQDALLKALADDDPALRRAVAIAMGRL